MEITLSPERLFRLIPQITPEEGQRRVEAKKVALVAGTLGSLLSRPNPDDFELTYTESRLEPIWFVGVRIRNVYERTKTFPLQPTGPEVKEVRLLGHTLSIESGKGITIPGIEYCEEERVLERTFAGDGTVQPDLVKFTQFAAEELTDLTTLQDYGLPILPEARSAAVVRQVMAEAVKPLKAQVIHEESVVVERLALYFRPVYAFEYNWTSKGKRATLEVDGLTGEIRQGGRTFQNQMKKLLSRDLLFDLSADVAGTFIPGGSIVVKLAKAAADFKNR
jgi:hypothetical protein